jgi:hypothetical protein
MAWAKGGGREKNAETLLDIGIDLITASLSISSSPSAYPVIHILVQL